MWLCVTFTLRFILSARPHNCSNRKTTTIAMCMLSPCSVCPAWTTELGEKEDCSHVYDRWYRNIESLWFSLQLLLEKGFTAELENILQCSRAHACIITEGLFWFHIPFFFTRSQRQVVWTHIKEGLTFAYAGGGRLKHSRKKKIQSKNMFTGTNVHTNSISAPMIEGSVVSIL